jgi:hypothetical protein
MGEGEVMPRKFLAQQWKEFQSDRVHRIREWYFEHYKNMRGGDPLVQYIVLWTVFNALYNTHDLPNNHLPEKINGRYRFRNKFGHNMPVINTNGDMERVKRIAERLAGLESFRNLLLQPDLKRHIITFENRIPTIVQDEEVDGNRAIPIILQDEARKWVYESNFIPAQVRGVASLDHRLFLADGYKFYEYAAIDKVWDDKGNIPNPDLSIKQLLNILYLLRNNIVHGGSAAYSRKEIILEAQPILDTIVEFVFQNEEVVFTGN